MGTSNQDFETVLYWLCIHIHVTKLIVPMARQRKTLQRVTEFKRKKENPSSSTIKLQWKKEMIYGTN